VGRDAVRRHRPEDFYDFNRGAADGAARRRRLAPHPLAENDFRWQRPGVARVILLRGVEPQLKWRTFCEEILDLADALQARWS